MNAVVGILGAIGLTGVCFELATPKYLRRPGVMWASLALLGAAWTIVCVGGAR